MKTLTYAEKMDRKFELIRLAWQRLNRLQVQALNLQEKMGDEAWRKYAAERHVDFDIFKAFGDAGA